MFVVSARVQKQSLVLLLQLVVDVVEQVSNKWDRDHSWFNKLVEIVMVKELLSEILACKNILFNIS
jgi:hypothetical protein